MHITTFTQLPAAKQKMLIYSLLGLGLLLTGLFSGVAMSAKGLLPFGGGGDKVPIYISADPRVGDQVTLNGGFASVAKAVTPAVVTVQTSSRTRPQQSPFFNDPFGPFGADPFRDFFFRRGQP